MSATASLIMFDKVMALGLTLFEMKAMRDKFKQAEAEKGAGLSDEEVDAMLDAEAKRVADRVQAQIDAVV